MQQDYNPDGTRNRQYRPYIFAEETTYNTNLYDPFRSVNYGLYSRGVPPPALSNAMDIYYYEKLIDPRWTPQQGITFPVTGADQSRLYRNYACVQERGKSQPYRRVFAT